MVSSTAVIFLLAVLTATEASSASHRVGREADFQASQTTFETADAVEAGEVVEEVDSVAADTVVEEDAAVLEEEEGEMMGIAELTNALNEDFSAAPLFVYVLIGIIVAIGVGVPALAVMRWRSARRALSEKESLSLIRHAHTMSPTGFLSNPNSPKFVPQWSPRHGGSPYSSTPSTPAGSNTGQQMTMRARTPNRVEAPPSPNRQFLSQMKVGGVMPAPPSPGRDIDV